MAPLIGLSVIAEYPVSAAAVQANPSVMARFAVGCDQPAKKATRSHGADSRLASIASRADDPGARPEELVGRAERGRQCDRQ